MYVAGPKNRTRPTLHINGVGRVLICRPAYRLLLTADYSVLKYAMTSAASCGVMWKRGIG